jgi:hypothetical protein
MRLARSFDPQTFNVPPSCFVCVSFVQRVRRPAMVHTTHSGDSRGWIGGWIFVAMPENLRLWLWTMLLRADSDLKPQA